MKKSLFTAFLSLILAFTFIGNTDTLPPDTDVGITTVVDVDDIGTMEEFTSFTTVSGETFTDINITDPPGFTTTTKDLNITYTSDFEQSDQSINLFRPVNSYHTTYNKSSVTTTPLNTVRYPDIGYHYLC